MRYTVRPISDRTPFTGKHIDSRFTTTWSGCLELLERELTFLDAKEVVLEVDVAESGIRMDGQLRADAKAASPAVRVAFESKHGPLTYATDKFSAVGWRSNVKMRQDWQHNVYAIALSLEALRKVDRYGVTKRGEQYAGWKALPSGSGSADSHMTTDEAWSILGSFDSRPISEQRESPDGLRKAHRAARAFAHPDRHGGDQSLWDQVEQAAKVLGVLS